jgi:hypothetical protein
VTVIGILFYVKTGASSCKEGFITTPNGATATNGVLHGYNMITDQQIHKPINKILEDVEKNGSVTDGMQVDGITREGGLDDAWKNQMEIQELDATSTTGFHQQQNLHKMSQKISEVGDNTNICLFSRAGDKPQKLVLMPNANISVMEEKYYPDRHKNHQLFVANSITPVQGFDVNVERLGEELNCVHNSAFALNKNNKGRSRKATSAGAGHDAVGSAINNEVVEIKQGGKNKIMIKSDTSAGTKWASYDEGKPQDETISNKFAIDGALPVKNNSEMIKTEIAEKEGFVHRPGFRLH